MAASVAWLLDAPAFDSAAAAGVAGQMVIAHIGIPPAPHDALSAWTFEPAVVFGLATAAVLCTRGVRRTWQRAGAGRVFDARSTYAAAAGLAVLLIALVSPVDAIGSALFSAHMVQHLLLVSVAAPLLVAGGVTDAVFRGLPLVVRRSLARAAARTGIRYAWSGLRRPGPAFLLHVGFLWLWHLPQYYDAAIRFESVHALEHVTMLGSAFLFWIPLLGRNPRVRMPRGAAILYLFVFGLQMSLLGAALAMSDSPWYSGHAAWTAAWGLSPLEDQQVAGAIMWVPGGALYLAAVAVLFLGWMRDMEARSPVVVSEPDGVMPPPRWVE